jgi:hypothetical protein
MAITAGAVTALQAQGVDPGAADESGLLAHPAAVDQARLAAANKDPGQWMSHGRDWT